MSYIGYGHILPIGKSSKHTFTVYKNAKWKLTPPLPVPTGRSGLDKCMFIGIKGGSLLMITQVF